MFFIQQKLPLQKLGLFINIFKNNKYNYIRKFFSSIHMKNKYKNSYFYFFIAIEIVTINYPVNAIFDNLRDEFLSSYQIKRIFYNNNKFSVSEKIKESEDGKQYIKIKRNFTMKILRQNKIDLLQLRDDNSTIKLKYSLPEKAWVFIGHMEDRFGVKDCLAIKISENLNF